MKQNSYQKLPKKEFKTNLPNIDENIIKSTLKNEFEIEKEESPSKKINYNFEIFNKIINDKFNELYGIFEERFNRIDVAINDINSKIDRVGNLKNNEIEKLKEENQNVEISKKYILTGLKHIDQIPFINEVIQCLIHTEPLTDFFRNYYIDNNDTTFALTYKKLIDKMVDNNNKSIEEKYFVDIITELISLKQYDKKKINNIFDFLEFILMQLHEELKQEINPVNCKTWNELEKQAYEKEIGKEQSLITKIFQGFLKINNTENNEFIKFLYLLFELNSEKLGNQISIFDLLCNIHNENIININEELKNIGDNSSVNKKTEFFIYPIDNNVKKQKQ